ARGRTSPHWAPRDHRAPSPTARTLPELRIRPGRYPYPHRDAGKDVRRVCGTRARCCDGANAPALFLIEREQLGRRVQVRRPLYDGAVAAGIAGMIVSRRRHHMADTTVQRTNELLYLDDLHVGRRFTSGTHALDEKQITAFAREFDPQLFHTDHEAAKATLFHGLAASGWHTAAITMRLQVNGGLPIAGGIVGLGGEVAWPKATRPGD